MDHLIEDRDLPGRPAASWDQLLRIRDDGTLEPDVDLLAYPGGWGHHGGVDLQCVRRGGDMGALPAGGHRGRETENDQGDARCGYQPLHRG
jgi:hypothetical protein